LSTSSVQTTSAMADLPGARVRNVSVQPTQARTVPR
jgi:hypothetical protein